MPLLPWPSRRATVRLAPGAAAVALLVMASACGGGGSGGGSGSASGNGSAGNTAAPPTRQVSTTAPPPGAAQLQSITIQPSDLPAGWTAKPAAPPANQAADTTAFAQCVGATNTSGDVVATAYSPDYANGASVVTSTATSFKSPGDVQADAAALTNPKASACFVQVVKARLAAALPKGAAVRSVTLKITPGTGGGPANVVATAAGTIVFAAGGHQVTLNDDIVFLIAPRIEAHVDFYSVGKAFPAQVKAAVVDKVSPRVNNGS